VKMMRKKMTEYYCSRVLDKYGGDMPIKEWCPDYKKNRNKACAICPCSATPGEVSTFIKWSKPYHKRINLRINLRTKDEKSTKKDVDKRRKFDPKKDWPRKL
jgi:hypothetical protein